MSLSSPTSRNNYLGNDTTATYSYTFRIFLDTDILVIVRNVTTSVETTLVKTTDYTVSGAGDASGSITLVNSAQAWMSAGGFLDSDYQLIIKRNVPLTQLTDIRNQGDFFPEAHEDEFDKSRMIDQQQQDEIDRSLKLSDTIDPDDFDATIPAALVGEVNTVFMTNATGDGFVVGPSLATLSSAEANAIAAAASAVAAAASAAEAAAAVDGITFVAVQSIAAGGTITPVGQPRQILKVQGNGAARTTANAPFSVSVTDGFNVILLGQDATNTLTIPYADVAGGCLLNGDCTLGLNATLNLVYDATANRYIELSRSV